MTNSEKTALSRRTFVKGSALAGLGAAAVGTTSLFGCAPQGAGSGDAELAETGDAASVDEKICWGHCAVNCECRCALRFHVVDDEVAWVETDNTGDDTYGDHQLRACQRGRSIRRWINHPDRLTVPLKRVGKRGEGKFEEISWDEALDTIAEAYKKVLDEYGPEAVLVQYATGVQAQQHPQLREAPRLHQRRLPEDLRRLIPRPRSGQALPWLYGGREANGTSDVANSKLVVLFGDNSCETKMSGGGPTYHYMMGAGEVRREGHRHRPALHRRRRPFMPTSGSPCVPVPMRRSWTPCAYVMITEDLVDHDFLSTVLRRLRRRHHARGTARPGQVLRGLHHRQGRGQNREDPGVGERHHAACPPPTIATLARRDRRGEALLPSYQGIGPAAPRQRRADGPRHLHAGHSHRQRRHQRAATPGSTLGQLRHAGRLWHPEARQRRGQPPSACLTWIDAVDAGTRG